MKKSVIISLFSIQILILVGVAATSYFSFMNRARIRATQRVMVETQESLKTTIEVMDKVAARQEPEPSASQDLASGTPAPDFSLEDENGQTVTLKDLFGKKTLLVFSQEGCPYCKNFYPVLNEFQLRDAEVQVVIMQLESTPEQNKRYKAQEGIQAPILAATIQELINYRVEGTPTSILLDEKGIVLGSQPVQHLDELLSFVKSSVSPTNS